ncbi:MAG: RpiB/LacA/LacB family sugar-phosphate isomerase [Bacilli bacterium]|nr:RpiB/LacA/LacB family sugar-phosphate isomerase [Bacilli bacterium]
MEERQATLEDIVKNDYQEKTILDLNIPDKKIGIASDHRGYDLKQKLTKYLTKKGYTVIDYGCDDKQSHDYPIYGFKLGEAIRDKKVEKAIAICGSGIGISIACNKVPKVRCAKVNNSKEAKYTRKDNDANIIAISGEMSTFKAKDIVDVFLKTPFSNEPRHKKRIEMIDNYKC